jgi:monofunctional glycosyltransferase
MAKAKRSLVRTAARVALFCGLGFLAATILPVVLLRFIDPPTTAFMLARQSEAADKGEKGFKLRHKWVPLTRVSAHYPRSVIASEDQNFGTHFGFDKDAIEDAIEDRLEGRSRRGASTITQQVAKNLFLWPARSWIRKALEVWFTVLIEATWSKHRILEVHANIAELGNGIYGVEAASQVWFKKPAAELNADEAAALAAILPSPKKRRPDAPDELAAERARWILEQVEHLSPEVNKLVPAP